MSSIKTGMIFLLALLGFGATGLAQTSTTNGGGSSNKRCQAIKGEAIKGVKQ